jgi:hypothetical protein
MHNAPHEGHVLTSLPNLFGHNLQNDNRHVPHTNSARRSRCDTQNFFKALRSGNAAADAAASSLGPSL